MSSSADDSGDGFEYPEKSYSNPFRRGTYLHDLFGAILKQDRDLIIIVDDQRGRRGTGKTTASLKLAEAMDQNQGLTASHVSLEVEEIRNAYTDLPPRSGLVLDEAEVNASNRDPMTTTNKALREIMSMGRVEQKYVVVNTPIKEFIDRDIRRLADCWISMTRRGRALVHQFKWIPYGAILTTPKRQWLNVNDIPSDEPLKDVYHYLTREKNRRIEGGEGGAFVPQAEHQEALEKAREVARREERDDLIRALWSNEEIRDNLTQRLLAEPLPITPRRVSQIINET